MHKQNPASWWAWIFYFIAFFFKEIDHNAFMKYEKKKISGWSTLRRQRTTSAANGFPSTGKVGAFQWLGCFRTFSTNMSRLYQCLVHICCCQRVTDAPRSAHFTVIACCQIHLHLAVPYSWHATILNRLNPSANISKLSSASHSHKVALMKSAVHSRFLSVCSIMRRNRGLFPTVIIRLQHKKVGNNKPSRTSIPFEEVWGNYRTYIESPVFALKQHLGYFWLSLTNLNSFPVLPHWCTEEKKTKNVTVIIRHRD